jgi:hypothetical protein
MIRFGTQVEAMLNEADKSMANTLGTRFDILYNRMSPEERRQIRERANVTTTMFSTYEPQRARPKDRLDREGRMLQEDALLLGKEASIANQLL